MNLFSLVSGTSNFWIQDTRYGNKFNMIIMCIVINGKIGETLNVEYRKSCICDKTLVVLVDQSLIKLVLVFFKTWVTWSTRSKGGGGQEPT